MIFILVGMGSEGGVSISVQFIAAPMKIDVRVRVLMGVIIFWVSEIAVVFGPRLLNHSVIRVSRKEYMVVKPNEINVMIKIV